MLAVLSNVNTDCVLKQLSECFDTVPAIGYADVWGQLLDKDSSLNKANPDVIVMIIDIEQLVFSENDTQNKKLVIDEWFGILDSVINRNIQYYVSDVVFRSIELEDNDFFSHELIEYYWLTKLLELKEKHTNLHALKIANDIRRVGYEKVFSDKMWYIGKIPYTNEGTKLISSIIEATLDLSNRTTKKALVLDLDNTLWGGVLGEKGTEGIELSDDHIGAIYKKVQKQILCMKNHGILLTICSKNNMSDVLEVWEKNSHMLLKKDDFVSIKINWKDKADNIIEIANELNIGVDSLVFIDDMPVERENVKTRLPDVVVPEFPKRIEEYPNFMEEIFNTYFKRLKSTSEDLFKTQQYVENAKRFEASKGLTFDEFIKSLSLKIERLDVNDTNIDRIVQLIGKTNQFNLTTQRYSRSEIEKMMSDGYKVYAYSIKDKFGDYGLVAVAIVSLECPYIDTFLMSCRVMGKLVENYIIDDIEKDILSMGNSTLRAKYIATPKNIPVAEFYDGLGYDVKYTSAEEKIYEINLMNRTERKFFVNI